MAIKVGDLWPSVSGGASLGINQLSNGGIDSEIRPFSRVHFNSGIIHGPTGSSGVVRFSSDSLEISPNGGKEFLFNFSKKELLPLVAIPIDETGVSGLISNSNGGLYLTAKDRIRISPVKFIELLTPAQIFSNAYSGITNTSLTSIIDVSPSIVLNSSNQIINQARKVYFSPITGNTSALLNISGTLTRPSADIQAGDLYLFRHSAIEDIGTATQASTEAEADARSLGYETLVYNTGSGIINILTGSGIIQALNSSAMKVTTASQRLPINSSYQASDKNYIVGTGASSGQITIMTPGLYKASLKILATKTIGSNPQTVTSQARLNSGNILGSTITSFHYDAVNAAANAASTVTIFNANAGDIFDVVASSTLAGADNCDVGVRGALVVIEKLGPKRGTAA